MKKKILIYFFIFTLIFPFSFIKPQSASANPGFRVVGSLAEKAFISISEKAGAKYATEKASEKAMKRWNMELYEDLAKQTNLNNVNETIKRAEIIPFPETDSRYGKFGKIMVGGALFLTGADIAIDVYESIKNAEDEQTMLELMENFEMPENEYKSIRGFRVVPDSQPTTSTFKLVNDFEDLTYTLSGYGTSYFSFPTSISYKKYSNSVSVYVKTINSLTQNTNKHTVSVPMSIWNILGDYEAPPIVEEVPFGWSSPLEVPDFVREYREADPLRKEEIIKEVEHAFPEGVPIVVPIKETAPGEPLEIDDKEYEEVPYQWNDPLPDTLPDSPTEPGTDPGTETPTEPGTDPGTETPTDPGTGEPPTDPPPGDGGNPVKKINWPKLKAIPMAFTTAFPFSLPWDIAKGLDATFGSIDERKGDIKFTWNAYKESTPITFTVPEMFLDWFKYIRSFVLIIFDITFIYAVRKLLGGAS